MPERDGQLRLAPEPAVRHDANKVLRRQRFGDGHEKLDRMLVLREALFQEEVLVVQQHFAVDVLETTRARARNKMRNKCEG